jgi:predicted RNA-binding Zn-ribbon protein involved in translation (DUF1610 family)
MAGSNKGRWRLVLLSYPCPDCGAGPGELCTTRSGRPAHDYVHAARVQDAPRCGRCGTHLPADTEPGDLCDYCAMVQALQVERFRRPINRKE